MNHQLAYYIQIKNILKKVNAKRIFVVRGNSSYNKLEDIEKLETVLKDYETTYFSDYKSNPSIEDIQKGINIFNIHQRDIILAIGGGSTLDIAKSIKLLNKSENIKEIINKKQNINLNNIPIIAVPTTCGSGSEVTPFSVVYIKDVKHSLEHTSMLPDYVVLDARLLKSLPPYVQSCTVLDSIAQAIESYFSVNSNHESKGYSIKSLLLLRKTILDEMPIEMKNENLLKASHLSGKAIAIAKTTASHAISYTLTKQFSIPHGHAVFMTLMHIVSYNYFFDKNNIIKQLLQDISINSIEAFLKWLRDVLEYLDISISRKKYDYIFSKDNVNAIINSINQDRLKNNPVVINKEEILNILTTEEEDYFNALKNKKK